MDGKEYLSAACESVREEIEKALGNGSIYDYFEDRDIYREDFTASISHRGAVYSSVSLMVAFGGPNVCIDTGTGAIEGYWWGVRASAPLSEEAVEAIDAWELERLQCIGIDIA